MKNIDISGATMKSKIEFCHFHHVRTFDRLSIYFYHFYFFFFFFFGRRFLFFNVGIIQTINVSKNGAQEPSEENVVSASENGIKHLKKWLELRKMKCNKGNSELFK